MNKKYFGSFSLQYTIRKVKETFPECKVLFKEEDIKTVSFKFDPESRKKYHLTEGYRTYSFLNGHLILSNGPIDPFKYDALDQLIETTELSYDTEQKKESIGKIQRALQGCIDFYNTTEVEFGNKDGSEYDIRFVLNDVERVYHLDLNSDDVHLKKMDAETELRDSRKYELKQLSPNIVYRILKTTHPGLLTTATEYISGIREDKKDWKSVTEAYVKPWKKAAYESFGISAFDVLADVTETILVGPYTENPVRHLVLIDGSEYAYREIPLEVTPYEDYKAKRDQILKQYKTSIMTVCKTTGVIPPQAIEVMNIYKGKVKGPVVLMDTREAIVSIRKSSLESPLQDIINKINRSLKLHNHEIGFMAYLRKNKEPSYVKKVDINENGTVIRIDVDLKNLTMSNPYIMSVGRQKKEVEDLDRFEMASGFIAAMTEELKKLQGKPEYQAFLFTQEAEAAGLKEAGIVEEDDGIDLYESYRYDPTGLIVYLNPYKKELAVNDPDLIQKDPETEKIYEKVDEIFESIFEK